MSEPVDPLPWQLVAARLSYRLTFGRTEPREFRPGELFGPDTPDALGLRERVPGDWGKAECLEETDLTVTDQEWVAHYLSLALNEAVHEVLEWFQIDGARYLNPHGRHESEIYDYVNVLADKLAALAESGEDEVR